MSEQKPLIPWWTLRLAKTVKNPPAMQDTQVPSQRDNLLEKGMVIHSSILAWRTPWTEEPGRLQSMGSQELDMSERLFCTKAGINLQGDQVSSPSSGSIIVCRLPQKDSCQGNSQRRLTAKGHLPTVLAVASGTSPFFKTVGLSVWNIKVHNTATSPQELWC